MTKNTRLKLTDSLPLTCARTGTCCHGKSVRINPFELASLAMAKGIPVREFRDRFCEGGIVLRFDGAPGWKGLPACSQYESGAGCAVHAGRPLACRLFPLGRLRQGNDLYYMFQGKAFPCLEGCPEVAELPMLTVGNYVVGQGTLGFERAQDAYLELMQDLADGAFAFLLESGLSVAEQRRVLREWRGWAVLEPGTSAQRLGSFWYDSLVLPEGLPGSDSVAFCAAHRDLLLQRVEEAFAEARGAAARGVASALLMGLALHLARAVGMEAHSLGERWVAQAQELGATL